MSNSRRSFHLCSRRKPRMTGAAMDSLCSSFGGKLSPEALLAAKEHVIVYAIVRFWRCKTRFVATPPSRPLRNSDRQKNVKFRYIRQAAHRLRAEFDPDVPKSVDKLCSLSGVGSKTAFFRAYMRLGIYVWCVLSCFRSSETMPALSRPFHDFAHAQVPRQPTQ